MLSGDRLVAPTPATDVLLLLTREFRRARTQGGQRPDVDGPVHIAFAIERAHLAAWASRLAHLGIEIESRVQWEGGGTSLYFRDPEGRSVELATPGIWPTY